ncbi:MAG: hypothetical protein IT449_17400 [Phycisphaerales bacterium]|nr:hypothetical protein [Phycisphaerales bacterium]
MKTECRLSGLLFHPKGAAPVMIPWSKLRWRPYGLVLLPEGELFVHPQLPRWTFLDTKAERLARVHRTRLLHHQFRGGRLHLSASMREPWWLAPSFSLSALGYFLWFFLRHGALRKWAAGPSAFVFEGEPAWFGLMAWVLLPLTVLLICAIPLLPAILMRHQLVWRFRYPAANALEIDSNGLRALRGAATLAAYRWQELHSIGLYGMRFDQSAGGSVWVPFPNERMPGQLRDMARLVLRGERRQNALKRHMSPWLWWVGLGGLVGAACFKAMIDRWLQDHGAELAPDQRWGGWIGIAIVTLLGAAAFALRRLQTRGSPKTRRTIRRCAGVLG